MADFDAFETADQPPQNVEEDPAAAFLAREQTELAGLEDDNFEAENPPQQTDFDPFTGEAQQNGDSQGDFFGGEDVQDMGYSQENDDQWTTEHSDAYSAISQVDSERQEPEVITRWREEQKSRLEKKDAEEEKKVKEWRDMAKKELDDWYKHHSEQMEKTRDNNRAAEAAFTKERDETQPGGEWEKICRFCEFNPKNSKTTKDVSRMRSILLQLKQTPLVR